MDVIDLVAKIGTDTSEMSRGMREVSTAVGQMESSFNKSMSNMQSHADQTAKRIAQSLRQTMNFRAQDMMASNTAGFDKIAKSISDSMAKIGTNTNGVGKSMQNVNNNAQNMGRHIQNANGHSEGFFRTWWEVSKNVFNVMMSFRAMGGVLQSILGPGFEFTKQMETMELGTAGILMSMTQINGKDMEWGQALGVSKKLMGDIANDALVTLSTTAELAKTFQSVLAPAMAAGFSVDQVREFAKVGSNAVSAIGLPAQQQVQELRALVNGGIRASVDTLAASLGVTNELWKKWKDEGKLFDNLMARMSGMSRAARETQDSFMGLISNIQDGMQRVSGMGLASTFAEFKNVLKEIQGSFFTIVPVMAEVDGVMKEISQTAVFTDQTLAIYYELSYYIVTVWREIRKVFNDNLPLIKQIGTALLGLKDHAEKIGQLIAVWFATQNKWTMIISLLEHFGKLEEAIDFVSEHIETLITLIEVKLVASFFGMSASAVANATISVAAIGTITFAVEILSASCLTVGEKFKWLIELLTYTIVPKFISQMAIMRLAALSVGLAVVGAMLGMGAQLSGADSTKQAAADESASWGAGNGGEFAPQPERDYIDPYAMNSRTNVTDMLRGEREKAAKEGNKDDKITSKYPPEGKGDKGAAGAADRASDADVKARLDMLLENLKLQQKQLDAMKEDNAISLTEYWQRTVQITKDGIQARIDAEKELLLTAKDGAEVNKINGQIARLNIQLKEAEVDATRKYTKELIALNQELEKGQLEFVGMVGAERALAYGIDANELFKSQAAEKYRVIIAKATEELKFLNAEEEKRALTLRELEVRANAVKLLAIAPEAQKLAEYAATAALATKDLNRQLEIEEVKIKQIAANVAAGKMSQAQGIKETRAAIQAEIALVEANIRVIEADTEAKKRNSVEWNANLAAANLNLTLLQVKLANTALIARDTLEKSFTDMFMSIFEGTKSATQAFADMAKAVIAELFRILVVQKLVQALLGAMGGGMGGGGGGSWGFSGGSIINASNFSEGGLSQGAGTGTSDSIPSMLSNGEYVIKAESVRNFGVPMLDFLNKYGTLPTRRFSEGGIVSTKAGGSSKSNSEPNIRFELINKSGEQIKMTNPRKSYDGTTLVVSAVLEGLKNNTMGLRDALGGRK